MPIYLFSLSRCYVVSWTRPLPSSAGEGSRVWSTRLVVKHLKLRPNYIPTTPLTGVSRGMRRGFIVFSPRFFLEGWAFAHAQTIALHHGKVFWRRTVSVNPFQNGRGHLIHTGLEWDFPAITPMQGRRNRYSWSGFGRTNICEKKGA